MENIVLKDNIEHWVKKNLGDFSFRPYQFEYIYKTIENILENKKVTLIEAPTGSGKSIMVLIMAGVLASCYGKKSYILCSDLYLWDQYATAIEKYNLHFGKIKGTFGNYVCDLTGADFSMAPCRLASIPYKNLYNSNWCNDEGWSCANNCLYIKERAKAINSFVTLMTYQLYFPYMNDEDVRDSYGNYIFEPRDVIFCDECHNVPNLCQQYGAIPLDLNRDSEKVRNVLEFCKRKKYILDDVIHMKEYDIDSFMIDFADIYHEIMECDKEDKVNLHFLLDKYHTMLHGIPLMCYDEIKKNYQQKKGKKKLSKEEYKAIDNSKWIDKHSCSIKIFLQYSSCGKEYIVRCDNMIYDQNEKQMVWPSDPIITYKFAREDIWVYQFILRHQSSTIMLSATIGDQNSFDDSIGTVFTKEKSTLFRIPSTFDFSKSPVYVLPGLKMSQQEIAKNLPLNAKVINNILKSPKHLNEKGIIHTGSYKNAFDLYDRLDEDVKQRIYIYGTSKEKQDILREFSESTSGVLIGPTLIEGIDLPEDGCRFIIILKIPYPCLGDELVKAKKNLFPRWYNSETSNNVIQGIGRGNRTPKDWSTTYILDGCFLSLYSQTISQYPLQLQQRIHYVSNNNGGN